MIKPAEYRRRRRQLIRTLGEGAIVLVPAAPVRKRNGDVAYPYRQGSDFHYLTGFPEPHAILALVPGRKRGEAILFCRERDPEREVWDGPMVGLDGARETYLMDDAFPIGDLDDIMPNLIDGTERLYYALGRDQEFDQQVMRWVARVREQRGHRHRAPEEFVSLDHYLHDMRLYKSRQELASLKRAAAIGVEAHRRAMRACRPGMMEYELGAALLHTFYSHQAEPSYQPIVGGGANACILHYVRNAEALRDGDLVLIDAGCEHDHYASDITRTFPVNGRFSGPQRDLYEVVLAAQLAAIDQVRPGRHWNAPHEAAVAVVTQGLRDLGLLKGDVDRLIEDGEYRPFYTHNTGHWLGIDVHDVGEYQIDGHPRELEPGMVMTVEPGVYLRPDHKRVPARFRGSGVRIEDDVVVTRDQPLVLSAAAPKTVAEIEDMMASDAD